MMAIWVTMVTLYQNKSFSFNNILMLAVELNFSERYKIDDSSRGRKRCYLLMSCPKKKSMYMSFKKIKYFNQVFIVLLQGKKVFGELQERLVESLQVSQ